jgi:hypothetical protein
MGDDYTLIHVPGLPWLTAVRLYDETWEHIVSQHGEFRLQLPSQREAVEIAIANPTSIHASATDPEKSVVFVSHVITYFGDPVVVPVRHVAGTSGRVVTAYFSGTPYPGKVLWSAGHE